MHDCGHSNPIRPHPEENAIGETSQERSADIPIDDRERERILCNQDENSFDELEEGLPKSLRLTFIPLKCFSSFILSNGCEPKPGGGS